MGGCGRAAWPLGASGAVRGPRRAALPGLILRGKRAILRRVGPYTSVLEGEMKRLTSEELRSHITTRLDENEKDRAKVRKGKLSDTKQGLVDRRLSQSSLAWGAELHCLLREARERIEDRVAVSVATFWQAQGALRDEEREWIIDGCRQIAENVRDRMLQIGNRRHKETGMSVPAEMAGQLAPTLVPDEAGRRELDLMVNDRRLGELERLRKTPIYLRWWWQAILALVAVGGLVKMLLFSE